MNTNKLLSALNYFSIFFAGIIFPIVVFFVSDDKKVKRHAKRALLSHLAILIPVPFMMYGIFIDAVDGTSLFLIVSILVFAILILIVILWNLVSGIKIFAREEFF